ncbi:MAG: YbaN family protein [Alphaproteobacteria bacterium]|nr:YbaN family protein [Alphaproteobacteria bacterium]
MRRAPLLRALFLALGFVCVALGLLGAVLPVLPTTPFMILALWCFARSSQRFHRWLLNHKMFGPSLQKWERHRVIPLAAKIASIVAMTASMVYVVFFSQAPWYAMAGMGLAVAYAAWYILSKPSRIPCPRG